MRMNPSFLYARKQDWSRGERGLYCTRGTSLAAHRAYAATGHPRPVGIRRRNCPGGASSLGMPEAASRRAMLPAIAHRCWPSSPGHRRPFCRGQREEVGTLPQRNRCMRRLRAACAGTPWGRRRTVNLARGETRQELDTWIGNRPRRFRRGRFHLSHVRHRPSTRARRPTIIVVAYGLNCVPLC